ncbi:MAG TPA: CAP domain-containing protein, partial [Armatimonadota bacterium]|nr:CAP domain-containing protein [Armatimonadota bacterium]
MHLSPRLIASLAIGASLMTVPAVSLQVHAESNPQPTSRPVLVEATVNGEVIRETEEERRFVDLVNMERRKRGLSQLVVDPMLIAVARGHSEEMRAKDYFNHQSPTPGLKTPLDRYLKAVGHSPAYACVGENLFWATVVDVERGHRAFMESPTHRENVLFPRFEK